MDRKWMHSRRDTKEYSYGMETFIDFAVKNAEDLNCILCPCIKCNNRMSRDIEDIRIHLLVHGIDQSYKHWIKHGENISDIIPDGGVVMKNETQHVEDIVDIESKEIFDHDHDHLVEMTRVIGENFKDCPEMFESLCNDAKTPLYPGCSKYSKLSALLKLYTIKVRGGIKDESFTSILEAMKDMLPDDNLLPDSIYEARKMMNSISMSCERIHACPNDCILYRKEHASLVNCPVCGVSRFDKENIAAKVMWYFPIVPRFRRLFGIAEEAKNLTWHANREEEKDGKLRHPSDSPQWMKFDHDFKEFGSESRNLLLALATGGLNPHGDKNNNHSTWPVILINYNLPPELCMKRKYMMLCMLISGPKQPGNDIDVYLAPLIEDLRLLWETGVDVFDAHCNENFNLKAMLFGTINDFPTYGNLSGYSVKGYEACPICDENTTSIRLRKSKKIVYMRHRRFLSRSHPYRRLRTAFDGNIEEDEPPMPLTGQQVANKVEGLNVQHGKLCAKQVPTRGYKKRSIFFDLPYWKTLYVRHFIDVMHIEKNVCDSLISTLNHIVGKSKDGENPNLRIELAPEHVRHTITKLSSFFSEICSRVIDPVKLYSLQTNIVVTICQLEMYFPPSFFDSMVHLIVHLVREVQLCGPANLRCMYEIERYMKVLKGYVSSRSHPEGCIVERALIEESLEFCIPYISNVEAIGISKPRYTQYPSNVSDTWNWLSQGPSTDHDVMKSVDAEGGITNDHPPILNSSDIPKGISACKLALDKPKYRIVATGEVHMLESSTIHGVGLCDNHVRVTIKEAIEENTPLPKPLDGGAFIISEALNCLVEWPIELVIVDGMMKSSKQLKRKGDSEKVENDYKVDKYTVSSTRQ